MHHASKSLNLWVEPSHRKTKKEGSHLKRIYTLYFSSLPFPSLPFPLLSSPPFFLQQGATHRMRVSVVHPLISRMCVCINVELFHHLPYITFIFGYYFREFYIRDKREERREHPGPGGGGGGDFRIPLLECCLLQAIEGLV